MKKLKEQLYYYSNDQEANIIELNKFYYNVVHSQASKFGLMLNPTDEEGNQTKDIVTINTLTHEETVLFQLQTYPVYDLYYTNNQIFYKSYKNSLLFIFILNLDTQEICETKIECYSFAVSSNHLLYINTLNQFCYRHIISKKETVDTQIEAYFVTSFANIVSINYKDSKKELTKLFITNQKFEQVAEFDQEFWFNEGILCNYGEKYICPSENYEVKTGINQFQTENQFYTFAGATIMKALVTQNQKEYNIKYLLEQEEIFQKILLTTRKNHLMEQNKLIIQRNATQHSRFKLFKIITNDLQIVIFKSFNQIRGVLCGGFE